MADVTVKRQPPFRAEHVGSFLRPHALSGRRLILETAGKSHWEIVADKELRELEDQAINEVVQLQRDLGFYAVNDGEFRRREFWGSFFYKLEGFETVKPPISLEMFRSYIPDLAAFTDKAFAPITPTLLVCNGKIKHVGSGMIDEWNYLKSLLPPDRVKYAKISFPNPEIFHLRYKPGKAYDKNIYTNDKEYFADIALAYRTELQILYDAGCRNVTIDDPNLAYFCSQGFVTGCKDAGEDWNALLLGYIELYNDCIIRPRDMHLGVHLCRGNALSRHVAKGGYDPIAKELFQDLNADTYYLEYETERAGSLEPLTLLPAHKNVILGVVSSKFPELEDINQLKERVFQAADHMAKGVGQNRDEALKRIGVSPQCGFASHHSGNLVTRENMIAKLKLIRTLANEIWPNEP